MRIGVDVGGTNTDAVVMNGNEVVAAIKAPTTEDVESGIVSAVGEVLRQADIDTAMIESVMIGTTQFTNAFVERKRLVEVGILRLALPATTSLKPLVDWPRDLVEKVGTNVAMAHGGYEFDGREISALRPDEISDAAKAFEREGLTSIAISSVFAPMNQEMENKAADIVASEIPGAQVTLSSNIGRIGMVERENAAIMNASLMKLSRRVVSAFRSALEELGIAAPFFVSQNDGTLMTADYVEKYPVLTFASGPTNSMRGAAFLSNIKDAIVIDIGGTTTDVGVLTHGFPRESAVAVDVGGVKTNFRMPDILAIGLGGGSIVRNQGQDIGPDSVGYELTEKARIFGGSELTATDIAVAAGTADIGDKSQVDDLDPAIVRSGTDRMHSMLEETIDRVKTSAADVPVVLVGGGAVLVNKPLKGASEIVTPENAGVANAIGAAIAQVGGEVDRVFSYDEKGREQALDDAKREASDRAVAAGAVSQTVSIIDVEEVPLAYLPGGAVRVRVKAVGDLAVENPR
ncbi:MAG: hydantoinase/oxoprolinase N-terminal domain-containing protein [Rhizobiaceae bacterium]